MMIATSTLDVRTVLFFSNSRIMRTSNRRIAKVSNKERKEE
jgi:hypothetical protein